MDCQYLMPVVGGEVVPWICSLNGEDCRYNINGLYHRCDDYLWEFDEVSLESMQEAELNYREDEE